MPDTPNLRPATRDELMQSLSFALQFNGRKRVHDADELMARITAERLVEHLERSGYVVMHKPHWATMGRRGTWPGGLRRRRSRAGAISSDFCGCGALTFRRPGRGRGALPGTAYGRIMNDVDGATPFRPNASIGAQNRGRAGTLHARPPLEFP